MSAVPDWLPGVARVANTTDAGPMLPGSKWSLLLHTDEIDSDVAATIRALRAKSAWSHFVYDWAKDELVQCVALNRAAKSLKSGGDLGRTNAARVIQVEIVGRAHDAPNWPAVRNQRVGAMIARLAAVIPFRVEMPLPFYGDQAGFTVASKAAKQRMGWAAWYRFDAICGHQHAPANDHWDPGAINTAEILAAARGTSTPPVQEDDMPFTEAQLRAIVRSEVDASNKAQTTTIAGRTNELRQWLKLAVIDLLEPVAAKALGRSIRSAKDLSTAAAKVDKG